MNHDKRKKHHARSGASSPTPASRSARVAGARSRPADWAFFYRCYERTYRAHHSTPYLSLEFFERIGATMPEQRAARDRRARRAGRSAPRSTSSRRIRCGAATGARSSTSPACTSRPATTRRSSSASSAASRVRRRRAGRAQARARPAARDDAFGARDRRSGFRAGDRRLPRARAYRRRALGRRARGAQPVPGAAVAAAAPSRRTPKALDARPCRSIHVDLLHRPFRAASAAGSSLSDAQIPALRERVAAVAGDLLRVPDAASDDELALAHDRAYVAAVVAGTLDPSAMRRIGFPWSPAMVERSRRSAGATIAACRAALASGCGINLAGGTHHASRDVGEGFCVFNDSAVAARVMQAEGRASRIAVVDLDVHQGDGTASIFADDDSVYTFSMHGRNNFPFRKAASRFDIELDNGTGDDGVSRDAARCAPDRVRACRAGTRDLPRRRRSFRWRPPRPTRADQGRAGGARPSGARNIARARHSRRDRDGRRLRRCTRGHRRHTLPYDRDRTRALRRPNYAGARRARLDNACRRVHHSPQSRRSRS